MNKKVQKGIVAAVSAAMGSGMVAPIYAAAATGTNLDAQYKAAYDATVKATTSKSQKDLTDARVLVDGLYATVKGTANEYLATTLSSLLDPAQQVKLVELFAAFDKAEASLKQADINTSRDLLIAMPAQWVNTFSSRNDEIQQKLIAKVNDAVVKAEGSKLAADKTAAQALLDDIKTVTNNADVASWASSMQTRVDAVSTVVSVASVNAIAANQIKVVFNQAPADITKVTFAVAQAGAAITVTPTWNDAKTSVILTKSSNFVAGDYTVGVKNDTTDLGSSTVTISDQKIGKINILSSKLGVITKVDTNNNNAQIQTAYATYEVLDQYGNNITNSALATNITFQSGAADPSSIKVSKGLISFNAAAGLNLINMGNVIITGYDSSSGVSTTATLVATSQTGTLSDIQLGTALTNADGKVLTANDSTTVFYLPYTAYDTSGNQTTNMDLVKNGLILNAITQNGPQEYLTSSCPYVTARVVADPTDSKKAVIEVKADTTKIQVDMPVVITAMTWTGKSSQFNVTLKRQAVLAKFLLSAPTDAVADMEEKEIPFTAYDQNGKQLTKYTDFFDGGDVTKPLVTFSNAKLWENADGTATLKNIGMHASTNSSVPEVITASVSTGTGSFSTITINIQKTVKADTLQLDNTILLSNMQAPETGKAGATQKIDFGWDKAGLSVIDQYGRTMDMTTVNSNDAGPNYVIIAKSSGAAVGVTGVASTGRNHICVTANTAGSATVNFKLVTKADLAAAVNNVTTASSAQIAALDLSDTADYSAVFDKVNAADTKSQTMSVLNANDINDYTMDDGGSVYTSLDAGETYSQASVRDKSYDSEPAVYGLTSSGSKVILAGSPIISASLSNTSDFKIDYSPDYDSISVVANKFTDSTKTGASTTLTVTLTGADNKVHRVTTNVTSTTADPVAQSFDASVVTSYPGISKDGDKITVDLSKDTTFVNGNYITRVDNIDGSLTARAGVYFRAIDQYGSKAMKLASITVAQTSSTNVLKNNAFTVSANGQIKINPAVMSIDPANPDFADVTAVTTNGLSKTVRIIFTNPGASAAANAAVAKAEKSLSQVDYNAALALVNALPADTNSSTTKADLQQRLVVVQNNMNSAATSATKALASINADVTKVSNSDLVTAGVLRTISDNFSSYQNAIKTAPGYGTLSLSDIQTLVDNTNKQLVFPVALKALNNAVDTATMRAALENTDLGLDLSIYNQLNNLNKNNVAAAMLNNLAGKNNGYADKATIQADLNATAPIATILVQNVATGIANTLTLTSTTTLLPTVPAGYTIAVKSSSDVTKYDLTGLGVAAGTSNVVYTVTNTASGKTADTGTVVVTVQ